MTNKRRNVDRIGNPLLKTTGENGLTRNIVKVLAPFLRYLTEEGYFIKRRRAEIRIRTLEIVKNI